MLNAVHLKISLCIFLSTCLLASTQTWASQGKIAIIIDDIGYRKTDSHVLSLDKNITYSVLPHTPYGKKLAELGHAEHHDIMLHIPMESENGKLLGPGALTSKMSESHIRDQLSSAFKEIPFAIGINNHMGSRLTTMYKPMAWTMRFLKEQQLFFIDSMTSRKSKAKAVAKHFGVPTLSRHIFLDNQLDEAYITQQFQQLIAQAQRNKVAIGIAHPHPETIAALQILLPKLSEHNISLVPISQLFIPQNNALSFAQISD